MSTTIAKDCKHHGTGPHYAYGSRTPICRQCQTDRTRRLRLPQGRECMSCARTDADVTFRLVDECSACETQAKRVGRCYGCAKPLYLSRPCACEEET